MEFWQPLVGNLAAVALVISGWAQARPLVRHLSRRRRLALFGAVMGLAAALSMLLAVRLESGLLLDLRLAAVALASFFGGPMSGLIAAAIAIVVRLAFGGSTAWAAPLGILAAVAAGWGMALLSRGQFSKIAAALLLAAAVGCIGPVLAWAWDWLGLFEHVQAIPAQWGFNAAATAIACFLMLSSQRQQRERDLLRAAFAQSPDFVYIKSTDLKIVAVNNVVAAHYGYSDPAGLVGLTDRDLAPADRSMQLMAQDRSVIASETPVVNVEEELSDRSGATVYYETTKVPVRSDDGAVIGLAGVTRDVTSRRRLERDLEDHRNQLSYVLAQMSDGVAMYGPAPERRLVFCNDQYRALFPRTAGLRKPGVAIRDILRKALETGEESVPTGMQRDAWIEGVVERMGQTQQRDIELADGRVIGIRAQTTVDGGCLTVAGDVTEARRAEAAMREATEALRRLASTDGLTSLLNRRSFDATLDNEVLRARRQKRPLSLLLVDVDHFKAYNDRYGHQAGDEVLVRLGEVLRSALKRPGDAAARYGGEEFAAILPDTDEDGAFFIADTFRKALRDLGIEHAAGGKGVVTASVGIATFTGDEVTEGAEVLLRRADTALYSAKSAGRDRVMGWRPRDESARRRA